MEKSLFVGDGAIFTEHSEAESSGPELSAKEIARVLHSAWLQYRDLKHEVTTYFFTLNELHAMHRAWKEMARGRFINIDKKEIVDALASLVEDVIRPDPMPRGAYLMNMKYFRLYHAEKNLLMENLLREWEVITEGRELVGWNTSILENSQEINGYEVEQDGQQDDVAVHENEVEFRNNQNFRKKITELYNKVHGIVHDSVFQYLLCCLLITWPISLGIIGTKYMGCPTGHHVPYYFMLLGLIGVVAILMRLILMFFMMLPHPPIDWSKSWTWLKSLEICFIVINIVQMGFFFGADPSAETEPNQCKNFSRVALRTNYVSLTLMAAYLCFYIYKWANHFSYK